MNRLITVLILLLVSGIAFADPTGSLAQAKQFSDTLTPPSTDYSVAYLSQIFGTVGNVLNGASGQVLGKMFDIFNKGVLVVAAIWLGYTTITVSLRAAGEGSFMGQNKNVHLILLRIALGFALIIPSSTTGYSLLQDLFMKIVVAGVGLADQTWDAALNYIEYGGQLYIPPKVLSNDTDVTTNTLSNITPQAATNTPPTASLAPVTQIFVDEVCMLESKSWEKLQSTKSYVEGFHPIFHPNEGVVYFPGIGNSHDDSTVGTSSKQMAPQCGMATSYYELNKSTTKATISNVTYSSVNNPHAPLSASLAQNQSTYMKQYSFSALKQLVLSTLPAAKEWVKHGDGATMSTSAQSLYIKNNEKAIFSAILAYGNLITPYQHMLTMDSGTFFNAAVNYDPPGTEDTNNLTNNENNSVLDLKILPVAKKEGWIMAGSFYWTLEQMNQDAKSISISQLLPTTTPPPIYISSNQTYSATLLSAANLIVTDYAPGVATLWKTYVGAQQNSESSGLTAAPSNSSTDLASTLTMSSVSSLTYVQQDFATSDHYNPIVALMNEGTAILKAVADMWIAAIAITVGIAVFAGICDSSSPAGLIVQTALTWVKSILMLISVALLLPGAILAYYVPLYPFIIFTFAAVGWIMMVIEGMAAAPLVCVGLTHPEGSEFLGKAEQALMLFLSIFLRPALMVIGLVAAMVVSFVAFHMLIKGFTFVNSSLLSDSHNAMHSNNALVWLISFATLMVIFGLMTMELIEQCYKLIYQLPNSIMQWIGAPQNQMAQDYGQMAQGVKGAISTTASTTGQVAKGVSKANQGLEQVGGKLREQAKSNDGDQGKIEGDNGDGGGGGSGKPPAGTPPTGPVPLA